MPLNQLPEYSESVPFSGQSVTGAAAAAATLTFVAVAGQANVLEYVTLSYSGAASGAVTLSVADGATTVLNLDLSLALSTPYVLTLPGGGLSGTPGNAMTVTVSAGAASSVAKLSAGVSRF